MLADAQPPSRRDAHVRLGFLTAARDALLEPARRRLDPPIPQCMVPRRVVEDQCAVELARESLAKAPGDVVGSLARSGGDYDARGGEVEIVAESHLALVGRCRRSLSAQPVTKIYFACPTRRSALIRTEKDIVRLRRAHNVWTLGRDGEAAAQQLGLCLQHLRRLHLRHNAIAHAKMQLLKARTRTVGREVSRARKVQDGGRVGSGDAQGGDAWQ